MADDIRIIRIRRQTNFLVVGNEIVEDTTISYKACGLLVSVLAKPDDWQSRVSAMIRRTDGRDAVRAALRELRQRGYVSLVTRRDGQGKFNKAYYFFERPQDNNQPDPLRPRTENPSLDSAPNSPETGFPMPVGPTRAKPLIYKEPNNKRHRDQEPNTAAARDAGLAAANDPLEGSAAKLVAIGVSEPLVRRTKHQRLDGVWKSVTQNYPNNHLSQRRVAAHLLRHPEETVQVAISQRSMSVTEWNRLNRELIGKRGYGL